MIEVEKKFLLKPADIPRLTAGATFVSKKTLDDWYYDTADWQLTLQDIWLRSRNGRFELKVPIDKPQERKNAEHVDQYEEYDDESAIAQHLELPAGPLQEILTREGYEPFGPIRTIRTEYHIDAFTIDIDILPFGDTIAEIESLVAARGDVDPMIERILTFAKERGLTRTGRGRKVFEFIRRTNPAHYQALVDAGVK